VLGLAARCKPGGKPALRKTGSIAAQVANRVKSRGIVDGRQNGRSIFLSNPAGLINLVPGCRTGNRPLPSRGMTRLRRTGSGPIFVLPSRFDGGPFRPEAAIRKAHPGTRQVAPKGET
jgi:hypothetical protein